MSSRFDKKALLVLGLVAAAFLTLLGTRGLNEPDEGRYAEISREMALQQNWLVPHLNGVPHFQKPPLIYWLMAASIRCFGPNEWAVRLPSAAAAAGTVVLTMLMAGWLFGPSTRWKAGLILGTSVEFFVVARLVTADMLLTSWITAAIAGLVYYARRQRRRGLVLFYLGMALGFLAKGPMALLVPCSAGLLWQAMARRADGRRPALYWWLGLPLALAVGLSWFVLLVREYPALWEFFVHDELYDRVATNVHRRFKPIWFYIPILATAMAPWCLFLPGVLRRAWPRVRACQPDAFLFLGWVAVPLVVLSTVSSKLATYVLPFLPPLAILLARWWETAVGTPLWRRSLTAISVFFAVAVMASPSIAAAAETRYACTIEVPPYFRIWIGVTLCLFLLLPLLARVPAVHAVALPWLGVSLLSLFLALVSQADQFMLGGNATMRGLAAVVRQHSRDPAVPVFACDTRLNGMEFYLQRTIARSLGTSGVILPLDGELKKRIIANGILHVRRLEKGPAFMLVKKARFETDPLFARWRILARAGAFVLVEPAAQAKAAP